MEASIEIILYYTIFAGLLSIIYGYVTGSNIIPNLETRLNLRATIPSIESLIPIIAINNIRLILENCLGSNEKKM